MDTFLGYSLLSLRTVRTLVSSIGGVVVVFGTGNIGGGKSRCG